MTDRPDIAGQTALVTGASGAVGALLVRELVRLGCRTRVLVRQGQPNLFPPAVEVFEGALDDTQILQRASAGADVVFHLAAKLHVVDVAQQDQAEYRRVNVGGTRLLAQVAECAGIHRLVYFSTISVYGPSSSGLQFDERSAVRPESLYAETKAEGEQVVLSSAPSVVLRLAAVYGGRMKGNYPMLVRALAKGLFVPIGDGSNRRTLVHERDVVEAAVTAAWHPSASGQVYNVTDGDVHTLDAILAAICAALSRRQPRAYVPAPIARAVAGTLEDLFQLVGRRAPVHRQTVQKLLEDIAVRGDRIQNELLFSPQLNLRAGWNATVADLRRQGVIPNG